MLVKIIVEDFRLAGPLLQRRPGPGLPAERGVAHQVTRGLGDGILADRIDGEELVSERAVALPRVGDKFLRRLFVREAEASSEL